jgi:protein SCO1/2
MVPHRSDLAPPADLAPLADLARLALLLIAALPACAHAPGHDAHASGNAPPAGDSPASPDYFAASASSAATPSLFAHPWTWTDDHGQAVTLARWRGHPLVVTAMFTQCKATCPRTMAKLRRVHDDFQRAGRAVEFVVITLDPENDTPQVLSRFKSSAGLPESWHLLSGNLADTRSLRDLLGIHVVDDGPHILHDGRIVIFDADGRPARAFEGYALGDEVRL